VWGNFLRSRLAWQLHNRTNGRRPAGGRTSPSVQVPPARQGAGRERTGRGTRSNRPRDGKGEAGIKSVRGSSGGWSTRLSENGRAGR